MRSPRKLLPQQAGYFLKRARQTIKRNPILSGALNDPEMVKGADLVIETMRARGVIPSGFNVLHHLLEQGKSEHEAAVLAALVEKRLSQTKGAHL